MNYLCLFPAMIMKSVISTVLAVVKTISQSAESWYLSVMLQQLLWEILPQTVDVVHHPVQSRISACFSTPLCVETRVKNKKIKWVFIILWWKLILYLMYYLFSCSEAVGEHDFIDTYMIALIGHISLWSWTEYPLITGNGILLFMYFRQHSWGYIVRQEKRQSD